MRIPIFLSSCLLLICLSACSKKAETVNIPDIVKGDTLERVHAVLGDPSLEFPRDDWIIRVYGKFYVTFSNDIVISTYMHTPEEDSANKWSAFKHDHSRAAQ